MQMYPAEAANLLLSDDGIAFLLVSVGGETGSFEEQRLPAETLEALMTMLANCGTKGRSTAGADTIVELHNMVVCLKQCPLGHVSELACQVSRLNFVCVLRSRFTCRA
jgi:hypothetical protein